MRLHMIKEKTMPTNNPFGFSIPLPVSYNSPAFKDILDNGISRTFGYSGNPRLSAQAHAVIYPTPTPLFVLYVWGIPCLMDSPYLDKPIQRDTLSHQLSEWVQPSKLLRHHSIQSEVVPPDVWFTRLNDLWLLSQEPLHERSR